MKTKLSPEEMKSRDEKIILLMHSGQYTLEQIGSAYHITRERVRQIYNKGAKTTISRRKHYLFLKALRKHAKEIRFNCMACGRPVTYEEAGHAFKLCKKCRKIQLFYRDPYLTLKCTACGKDYHPLRVAPYFQSKRRIRMWGHFHSQECYLRFKKGKKGAK